MRVRCPECYHSVVAVKGENFSEIACPACGSDFRLLAEETVRVDSVGEDLIGHFKLTERLGFGAYGSVWKATDKELDRTVAIKIPSKGQLSTKEAERFLREARAAAQLKHPHIVSVHEVGKVDGQIYIVSDFVEGTTLADRLTGPSYSFKKSAILCRKIADALHHAHEEGVIHRDLKPSNIMLDTKDEPHIMDFGMAKRETGEITVTLEGKILGTPAYMSPEQAAGLSHEADRRSDIYSLGVVCYEMLTGEKPFRGNQRMVLHQVIHDDPKHPKSLNDSIPKDLNTITMKCIEKDPEKRYRTARDVSEELARYLNHEPIQARPIGRVQRFRRWCKRNPLIASLSFLLFFVLLGGILGTTYWALISQQEKKRADEQAQAAVDSLVDTLLLAPADSVPELLDRLKPFQTAALATLRRKFERADLSRKEKLHTAYALSLFGEGRPDFLIDAVITSSSDESENLVIALANSDVDISEELVRRFRMEGNSKSKVRWASTLLALREVDAATTMLKASSDPIERTVFIAHFKEWPGQIARVIHSIEMSENPAFRSGLYAALGWLESDSLKDEDEDKLLTLLRNDYLHAKDALTHSTAGWVLRKWNETIPELPSSREAPAGYQWYFDKNARMTMVRMEPGTLTVKENSDRQIQILTPFYISNMEVTRERYEEFISQLSNEDRQKFSEDVPDTDVSPSSNCPAQKMKLSAALRFCNWLSREARLIPCYRKNEHGEWSRDFHSSGFRLPTESEWEYAGRGGAATSFHFGNNPDYIHLFTVYGRNSLGKAHPCGSLIPNLSGLFDVQGNVQEWCWNEAPAKQTKLQSLEERDTNRIVRGGNWFYPKPSLCSPSTRITIRRVGGHHIIGFRIARNAY